MIRILISACLVGERVRYDGADRYVSHHQLRRWQLEGRLVPVCPEVAAGLPIPRAAAQIQYGQGGDVLDGIAEVRADDTGQLLTDEFRAGAQHALDVANRERVGLAILTDKSPSCGSRMIYDGSFSGTVRDGKGVTAALLERNGVRVFAQDQIEEAARFLASLDDKSDG